ncbi:hypothetical protein Sjap_002614 [Stephania japonica]|uniref:Uncharacterized protein n=1 Tax=Stephania japonica TaxID=461633 RepID=A0AAP0KNY6_9MAGN
MVVHAFDDSVAAGMFADLRGDKVGGCDGLPMKSVEFFCLVICYPQAEEHDISPRAIDLLSTDTVPNLTNLHLLVSNFFSIACNWSLRASMVSSNPVLVFCCLAGTIEDRE